MIYQIKPEENKIVNTYVDLKEVCEKLGVEASSIRKAMSGHQVTSYGFKWSRRHPEHKARVRSDIDDIKSARELTRILSDDLELELEGL